MNMELVALLPMKGHSERVPNKNMRDFSGRCLYHRIMENLLSIEYISSVVVNTDSNAIAEDVEKNFERVRVIDRPMEIQGDFVPMNDIIAYDLSQVEGEHFLQTHSTNPLLTPRGIKKAIETYFEGLGKHDSLFSVTRLQARLYWGDGQPVNHNPAELLRTQDLPPVFEENSNIYIFSKNSFKKAGDRRIGLNPRMFSIEKSESIDIDEEIDFKLAEIIYRMRQEA